MLRPLEDGVDTVQFDKPLTDGDLKRLSAFLRDYPHVTLRAISHVKVVKPNLEFLRYFGFLRRFRVEVFELADISGFSYLPEDVELLGFGRTRCTRYSLDFLERFANLRELYVEGHTKGFSVVSSLTKLERLTIRSVTLPDLSPLLPLSELWWLDIKLGGTRNVELLPRIGRLKYLELWMAKGLEDLSPVGDVTTLQYLFLQALRRVQRLPPCRKLRSLRRVHLQTMKGLRDLSPLSEAASLEDLLVVDAHHMQPEDFECLHGHPSLKRLSVGLGSARKNEGVAEFLRLPEARYEYHSWFEFV